MKISSYVLPHDYGFAPNPFGDFLTLATCKPVIRSNANVGDIILGVSSANSAMKSGHLIYAAIVSEVLPLESYATDARFEYKKPKPNDLKSSLGDNIYYQENGQWKQIPNGSHVISELEKDISGRNALICEQFWYFGDKAPKIPEHLLKIVCRGRSHKNTDDPELINQLQTWLNDFSQNGRIGKPSTKK